MFMLIFSQGIIHFSKFSQLKWGNCEQCLFEGYMVFREGEESRIKMVFVVLITCGVDIFHFSCQIIIPRNWISIKLICIKVVNNFERNWVFYISLIGLLMISRAKFNYKALLILLIYIIDLVSVQHGKAPSSQLRGANRTFTPF